MALSDTVSFFQYASCVALPYGCQYHAQYGDIEIMGIFTYGDKSIIFMDVFSLCYFFRAFVSHSFMNPLYRGGM